MNLIFTFIHQTNDDPINFQVTEEVTTDGVPNSILIGDFGSLEIAINAAINASKAFSAYPTTHAPFPQGPMKIQLMSTDVTQ
jgi:hypothetical protein